jgi:hypothetical protein
MTFEAAKNLLNPFRVRGFIASFPRVLPWAKLFNAFGVRTEFSHTLVSGWVGE